MAVSLTSPAPSVPKYKKVYVPSNDQLSKLKKYLNGGKNEIKFQIKNSS